MEHIGPFYFNGVRFALGFTTLLPFVLRNNRGTFGAALSRTGPAAGLAGLVLFAGASLQQIGIVYTTAGKAGFITGLYVVLVPIMGLALRAHTRWSTWVGALVAACGMYLLSVQPPLSIGLGDGLVLISALFWALHVLLIGRIAARHHVPDVVVVDVAVGEDALVDVLLPDDLLEEIHLPGRLAGLERRVQLPDHFVTPQGDFEHHLVRAQDGVDLCVVVRPVGDRDRAHQLEELVVEADGVLVAVEDAPPELLELGDAEVHLGATWVQLARL